MLTDSFINGIPMSVICRTSESIHNIGSCKEIPGQYLSELVHPQTGYRSALFIALFQWLLCMLPLHIALLECNTES
jgi:hypothetical protein